MSIEVSCFWVYALEVSCWCDWVYKSLTYLLLNSDYFRLYTLCLESDQQFEKEIKKKSTQSNPPSCVFLTSSSSQMRLVDMSDSWIFEICRFQDFVCLQFVKDFLVVWTGGGLWILALVQVYYHRGLKIFFSRL